MTPLSCTTFKNQPEIILSHLTREVKKTYFYKLCQFLTALVNFWGRNYSRLLNVAFLNLKVTSTKIHIFGKCENGDYR